MGSADHETGRDLGLSLIGTCLRRVRGRVLQEGAMSRVSRSLGTATLGALLIAGLAIPASASAVVESGSPADAAEYARQWNLRAIHAEAAWNVGELGSPGVAVAILDTGIDTEHPDLKGRVDLERSTSFLSRTSSCPPSDPGMRSGTAEDQDADLLGLPRVTDFHSHGTAVSGLISSNAVVLAGVTQRTRLFGVKVHDRVRRNCLTVYLDAVRYAADNGADVIHMSFPLEFVNTEFPGAAARINDTMEYAHRKGALLVAAAGNAMPPAPPQDLDADPNRVRFCKAIHVICVSATGPADPANVSAPAWDAPADYTFFGSGTPSSIDVAGPGGTGVFPNQIVPVTLACSRVTQVKTGAAGQCWSETKTTLHWPSTGTSFAAAATSGLLALLVDVIGKNRPDDVDAVLRASADSAADLGYAGLEAYYGDGRINVAAALLAAQSAK
jgi:serine protease